MVSFIPPLHRRTALQAAQADQEVVLITGAKGSGKSGIARWIHQNSPRSMQPFVSLKPGTITSEAILEAKNGTLFFAEYETLLSHEKEILVYLMKNSALPESISPQQTRQLIQARVILSAYEPIDHLLSVQPKFQIPLPLLSAREEEFEDIARALLREIAHQGKKDYLHGLDAAAWRLLKTHHWPGNLRELRNALNVAVLRAQGNEITAQDLPPLSGSSPIDLHASRADFEHDLLDKIIALAKKEITSKRG